MASRISFLALLIAGYAFGQPGRPLDIVFLVDVSQNMADPSAFAVAGARLATFELGPNDRVAVMSFSSGTKAQTGFTSDAGEIEKAFGKCARTIIRRPGKLCLYDALAVAIEQFPAEPDRSRKRVIAVISNDVDRGSKRGSAEVVREAQAKGVALWGFLMASPFPEPFQRKDGYSGVPYPNVHFAAAQFEPIATATGGKAVIRDTNGYVLRYAITACKGEE